MEIKKVGSGALLAVVLAACAAPEEQRQSLRETALAEGFVQVPAEDVPALFVDATHVGTLSDGEWQSYYAADSSLRGTFQGSQGKETDVGTYRVTPEGVYCREWSRWGNGQEGCAEVYQKGDVLRMIVVSGRIGRTPHYDAMHQPGNPFEL